MLSYAVSFASIVMRSVSVYVGVKDNPSSESYVTVSVAVTVLETMPFASMSWTVTSSESFSSGIPVIASQSTMMSP